MEPQHFLAALKMIAMKLLKSSIHFHLIKILFAYITTKTNDTSIWVFSQEKNYTNVFPRLIVLPCVPTKKLWQKNYLFIVIVTFLNFIFTFTYSFFLISTNAIWNYGIGNSCIFVVRAFCKVRITYTIFPIEHDTICGYVGPCFT